MKDFFDAVKNRRTLYEINDGYVIADEKILEIVKDAVSHCPAAFNSQTSRTLVLLGDEHKKLWDITKEILKKVVPKEKFSDTETRINGFKAGYGTVLFFEDQAVINKYQEDYELYKDKFPLWSLQSSGMLQFVVWTALELEGFGASLQHYDPLIDEEVVKNWNIPENWKLHSQLVFGKPTGKPKEKSFNNLDERVKFFK